MVTWDSIDGFNVFHATQGEYLENVYITGYIGNVSSADCVEELIQNNDIALVDLSKYILEKELELQYPDKKVRVTVPEKYIDLFCK